MTRMLAASRCRSGRSTSRPMSCSAPTVSSSVSDEALEVTCTIEGEGDLARMQQVVADHLNRFAHREGELAFDWQPL